MPTDAVCRVRSLREEISRSQRERLSASAHATETTSTIAPSNVRIEADDEGKVRDGLREFIEEMTKFVEDAEKNIASLMRGLRAKKT